MGTQKITYGRGKDTDYESKKAAAIAQAGAGNDFMWGIQSVYAQGAGQASKASRSQIYGNTNLMTGDLLDGNQGIFKPKNDAAGGRVPADPLNTSGYAEGGTSMTLQPQVDPEIGGQMAMDRVQMMANGVQYPGLNNRSQLYGA
jgi:hypothetical protein